MFTVDIDAPSHEMGEKFANMLQDGIAGAGFNTYCGARFVGNPMASQQDVYITFAARADAVSDTQPMPKTKTDHETAEQAINDFLKAVDRGYFGRMPEGFNDSAFTKALRRFQK